MERRQKEKEEERKNKTPDEVLAEKLRIQKIQEDSDFKLAADLLGDSKFSHLLLKHLFCGFEDHANFIMHK